MKNTKLILAAFTTLESLFAQTTIGQKRGGTVSFFSKSVSRYCIAILVMGLVINQEINSTPSTQIWIPSTDFQGWKTFHLGIDNYLRTKKINGIRGAAIYDLGLTTGLLLFSKIQGEIGVDYLYMGDNIYDDHPIYFNAKIGLPENALFKNSPAIAFGGYNFGLKKNLTVYNIVYGEVAKTISFIGRLSVGYYSGNEKVLVDENLNVANQGILLSWDRVMTEISDKLWFAVDYQGGKSYLGALNFGASWTFSKNVSVIFAYDIYNNKNAYYNTNNQNSNTFTAQIDINF
jgi:hypothetical protein